jgi:hypothetical protein
VTRGDSPVAACQVTQYRFVVCVNGFLVPTPTLLLHLPTLGTRTHPPWHTRRATRTRTRTRTGPGWDILLLTIMDTSSVFSPPGPRLSPPPSPAQDAAVGWHPDPPAPPYCLPHCLLPPARAAAYHGPAPAYHGPMRPKRLGGRWRKQLRLQRCPEESPPHARCVCVTRVCPQGVCVCVSARCVSVCLSARCVCVSVRKVCVCV